MALVVVGAMLVIVGVAIAAIRTAGRGRLSQPDGQASGRPGTLEPAGKGGRLSLKPDLLGLVMAVLGVLLIFAGALSRMRPG